MKKFLQFSRSGQEGFTLIEIMISLVIGAVLFGGAIAILNQMTGEHDRASKDMTAVQQVESAGFWVSRDAFIAQTVTTGEYAGFPLELAWQDWDFDASGNVVNHKVVYSLSGNSIQRTQSRNGVIEKQSAVASNINTDSAKTSCSYDDTVNIINLKLTATVETTSKSQEYQIKPRPDKPY